MTENLYIYRWDRQGRKGQACKMLVRARAMNSCLLRFCDGYTMVTSRNALKRQPVQKMHDKPSAQFPTFMHVKMSEMSDAEKVGC